MRVKVGETYVNFPDSMSKDEVRDALRKKFSAPISAKAPETTAATTVLSKPTDIINPFKSSNIMSAVKGVPAGFIGGIPDLVELPPRVAALGLAAAAKGAESYSGSPTATKVKDLAIGYATKPTYASKIQEKANEYIGEPKTQAERAYQSGGQTLGSLLTGGVIRKGISMAANKVGANIANKIPTSIQKTGNILFQKPTLASSGAALGGGTLSSYAQEMAGDNPISQLAAGATGMLVGGLGGYAGGASAKKVIGTLGRKSTPSTNVGKSLVKVVRPEDKFKYISKSVQKAQQDSTNIVNNNYNLAREVGTKASLTNDAVDDLKGRINTLVRGTADPDQKKVHTNVLKEINKIYQNGEVSLNDLYDNLRKSYQKTSVHFAKKEGIDTIDDFMNGALDAGRVSNIDENGVRLWKNAISSAHEHFTKFKDPKVVASIVEKDAKTNALLSPSKLSDAMRPNSNGSDVWEVSEAILKTLNPSQKNLAITAMKRGWVQDALKRSTMPTPSGIMYDSKKIQDNLMNIRMDEGAWRRFTPIEKKSINQAIAALSGEKINEKNIQNLLTGIVFATMGRLVPGTAHQAAASVLSTPSSLDDIIRMLDKPIPLSQKGNAIRRFTKSQVPVIPSVAAGTGKNEE